MWHCAPAPFSKSELMYSIYYRLLKTAYIDIREVAEARSAIFGSFRVESAFTIAEDKVSVVALVGALTVFGTSHGTGVGQLVLSLELWTEVAVPARVDELSGAGRRVRSFLSKVEGADSGAFSLTADGMCLTFLAAAALHT